MTYFKERLHFLETLKEIYPLPEIESIFFILIEDGLNISKIDFHNIKNNPIPESHIYFFTNALNDLLNHKPVQQIVGKAFFYDSFFLVNKYTLIPRNETEELVHWIIEDTQDLTLNILDIGTGTGCIPISIQLHSNHKLWAYDIDSIALKTAELNAQDNKTDIIFKKVDILKEPINSLNIDFDIIISNPPYVRPSEKEVMNESTLNYEPELALFIPEEDPLLFYRTIAEKTLNELKKECIIYFEVNQYLALETEKMMNQLGFYTELRKDINANFRMLKSWR